MSCRHIQSFRCVGARETTGRVDLLYLATVNKRAEETSIPHQGRPRNARSTANMGHGKADSKHDPGAVDDKELVARAKSGDHDAFRVLFQRNHRRAYSLAYGVLQNQDDALDVVQDAFVKAHRHLDTFEGASSFYTWLYRIVMNLAIDHIRKHRRVRHVDFDDTLAHGVDESTVGDESLLPSILGQNPKKSLLRKEIREQIDLALESLSENHRAVLIMRELDGLSYEEMAQAMNCSKGTIMSRLFHARKNMQKRLLELRGGHKDLEA